MTSKLPNIAEVQAFVIPVYCRHPLPVRNTGIDESGFSGWLKDKSVTRTEKE